MRNIYSRLVMVLLILSLLMSPALSFAAEKTTVENKLVEIDTAQWIANKFVVNNKSLRGDQVVYHTSLYDIDDSVLGYYFDILNENYLIGYIIVSATKEREPILEYGEGTIIDDFKNQTDRGMRTYYLKALDYFYATDSKDLRSKFESIKQNKINRLTDLKQSSNIEEKKSIDEEIQKMKNTQLKSLNKGSFEKEWITVVKDRKDVSVLSTTEKVLSVTRIWQRTNGVTWEDSACGPATGAMIANYFKSRGYSIRDSSYYGGDAKFINHLWSKMAYWWGTSAMSFRSEMEDHLNLDLSTHTFDAHGWDEPNFSIVKSQIDNNLPYGLRFETNSSADYSYHWVALIGYRTSSSGDFYAIKNPDGGQNNTGTKFISRATNEPYADHVMIDVN